MTSVRATCPECGDIRLPATAFVVRTLEGRDWGEYRFLCQCGKIVVKQASPNIVTLLTSSGVKHEKWELPLELLEHPSDDGILTEDSLIDLGLAIEAGDETLYDRITRKHDGLF